MKDSMEKKLLKDRRVVDEINRHQWIESEKAGYDIGFEKACVDWIDNFSKAWMQFHMPKRRPPIKSSKPSKSSRTSSSRKNHK